MRCKATKQHAWLSGLIDPTAGIVVDYLEENLFDLFPLYPYGFTDRLQEFLKEKPGLEAPRECKRDEGSEYFYAPGIFGASKSCDYRLDS
jgi:hypothetical protein